MDLIGVAVENNYNSGACAEPSQLFDNWSRSLAKWWFYWCWEAMNSGLPGWVSYKSTAPQGC